jgi:hypothetical protein
MPSLIVRIRGIPNLNPSRSVCHLKQSRESRRSILGIIQIGKMLDSDPLDEAIARLVWWMAPFVRPLSKHLAEFLYRAEFGIK